MDDANKIQRAMRRAAQAGDQEALDDLRERLQAVYQSEVSAPTEGMSTGQKLLAGIGQGMTNVARHAGNLVGATSDEDLAEAKQRDKALLDTGAGKVGAFIGETAATAPIGGLAGGAVKAGAGRLGLSKAAQWLATAGGAGASQGAAEGALMADPGERLKGAAIGAATGFAVPVLGGKAYRALVRGVQPTRAARELLSRGVDLTPGQMNPSGTINMLEEAAQSVPIVGPMVKGARDAAREGWQTAAREVGVPPNVVGDQARRQLAEQGLDPMYAKFGSAYDNAKGFPMRPAIMRTNGPDIPLADYPKVPGAFTRAAQNKGTFATDDVRKAAQGWLQNQLTSLAKAGKGMTTSDALLAMRSNIRAQIRAATQGGMHGPDPQAAAILREAEQQVTQALESQLTPDVLAKLAATDARYAQYKTLEDAARRAGDQPGGMTPAQLSAAVRSATPAGPYARGAGGELRTLARAGREVLDQRSPPTGARLASLLPVAAASWVAPTLALPAVVLGATKTGRRILAGNTAAQARAQDLARALRRKGIRGRSIGTAYGAAGGNAYMNEE